MRRPSVHARTLAALLIPCAALLGCQPPPAPVAAAPPPALPPHLGPPAAARCTVAPFHVDDGGTAAVSMTISNDGGYCAASLTASNGNPFDAPLVPQKPEHGEDSVVQYNHRTSVEYSANPGYVGHDAFVVHLILKGRPGYTTLNVSVDVQPVSPAAPKTS